MRCPNYEICGTPQLYGETDKKQYVQDVCETNQHKVCSHFMYGMFPKKGSKGYREAIAWFCAKRRELKKRERA